VPERALLSEEIRAVTRAAVSRLGPAQRAVITLRDLEGWDAREVCDLLGITDANHRVLLHRARAKIRQALEDYL
jgi:RNA polymerase sigma-70 factor, ECF subfamily